MRAAGIYGRLARAAAALGLLLAGEALLYLDRAAKDAWAGLGFCALGAGAALLWPGPDARKAGAAPAAWRATAWLGILGLGALGACSDWIRLQPPLDLCSGPVQAQPMAAVFWVFLALALAGLAGSAALADPDHAAAAGPPLRRRWEVLLLVLVLSVAGILRFYRGDQVPQGWWYDEVVLAGLCKALMLGLDKASLFVGGALQNPGAYVCVGAALFKLGGVSVHALRVGAGVFGLLAVVPLWALARLWLGGRWALVAAALFALMRWTLIAERIAFMSGFALFWMLASFWALWAAQLRGSIWRWFLAGLLLGANLHTYIPGRLVPALVFLFLGFQASLDRRWRRSPLEWAALGLGFLVLGGPMLAWMAAHWPDYMDRAGRVSLMAEVAREGRPLLPALWENFARHALMFHFRGDHNARHNIPSLPQADYLLACALALGFPWTLGRAWRDARARFLWLWLLVMLAAGVLSLAWEAPQANRSILAAPALPLAAAWALRDLSAPLAAALGKGWRRALTWLGALALAGMALSGAADYFHDWAGSEGAYRDFTPIDSAVARRVERTRPGTAVYTVPDWEQYCRLVLDPQDRIWNAFPISRPIWDSDDYQGSIPVDHVLMLWRDSDAFITDAVQKEFPGRPLERAVRPFAEPGESVYAYLGLEVPLGDLPVYTDPGHLPFICRRAQPMRRRDTPPANPH
jgi:hypothetical protein